MYIPIGMHYTSAQAGFAAREVQCEQCGERYMFDIHRQAAGWSFSLFFLNNSGARATAARRAAQGLQKKLRNSTDLVPCPTCGCCQSDAVARVRSELGSEARSWAILAFVISLVFVALDAIYIYDSQSPQRAPLFEARLRAEGRNPAEIRERSMLWLTGIATGAALIGFGLICLGRIRMALYDPSREELEKRIAAGRQRAYRPSDANLLVRARQTPTKAPKKGSAFEMLLWMLIASGLIGSGIAFGWPGLADLRKAKESESWPTSPGVITRCDHVNKKKGSGFVVRSDIAYSFSANGKEYTSDRLWFGPSQDAYANLARYPKGSAVTVHYQPSDPSIAVLETGTRGADSYWSIGMGSVLIMMGLLMAAFAIANRPRRHANFGTGKPTWRLTNAALGLKPV
jgi:hypothetical protein